MSATPTELNDNPRKRQKVLSEKPASRVSCLAVIFLLKMKPPVYHGEKVRTHYFNLRSLHFFRTFSFVENLKTRQISIRLLSVLVRPSTEFQHSLDLPEKSSRSKDAAMTG